MTLSKHEIITAKIDSVQTLEFGFVTIPNSMIVMANALKPKEVDE